MTPEEAAKRGLPLPLGWTTPGEKRKTMKTGLHAFDEMASTEGGLVLGASYILYGAPGVGKTSIELITAHTIGAKRRVVLALLEEENEIVRDRMVERFKLDADRVWVIAPNSIEELCEMLGSADLVILDSMQAMHDRSGASVLDIAKVANADAHANKRTWLLIGHIVKTGDAAGPEQLAHLVDALLELSGDDSSALRVLSSPKNRLCATDKRTFLRMQSDGLVDVPDATTYLLADRVPDAPGSTVGAVILPKTQTAVLVEVQAAVIPVPLTPEGKQVRSGAITASGIAPGRLRIPLAMLSSKCGIDTSDVDVFVKVASGSLGVEADLGLDLPIAIAIASAVEGIVVPPDLCAWGELGLQGEIRSVREVGSREKEAERSDFRTCAAHKRLVAAIESVLGVSCGRAKPTVELPSCPAPRTSKKSRRTSTKTPEKPTSTPKARRSPSRSAHNRK